MIVYLIGHGFVVPHFPQIQIAGGINVLNFYVPEGQLFEDFQANYVREHPNAEQEAIGEAFNQLVDASLYNGQRTLGLIIDDGGGAVEVIHAGVGMHEHLLHGLDGGDIANDLHGVNYVELPNLGHWGLGDFKVMQINNVNGVQKQDQYIVTIPWRRMLQNIDEDNNVYKLSWLIDRIIELKVNDFRFPAEESLQICWLACRSAMGGGNNVEFMEVYHLDGPQGGGVDNVIIDGIFP